MKQEITMIRMAGLRSGTMEVRITGVPFQMAEAWVTSRKNLGAATLTVESWTYSTPSQTLLATFSSPDVLSLEEAFFRRGWSYAADFKRIQFTDSPMCRCKAPSLSRDPAPGVEKALRRMDRLERAHRRAAHLVGTYHRILERVAAEDKQLRVLQGEQKNQIDALTLRAASLWKMNKHLSRKNLLLSDENKGLKAELEVEKDHVGILAHENKNLSHKIAVQEAYNQGIAGKNLALKADLKAEKERRKQDLSFLARDIAEETGGLVRISERVEALRAGKEPHPYKHNDERRD